MSVQITINYSKGSDLSSSYDNPISGDTHGAELSALFPGGANSNPDVETLFEQMREYWSSFVTNGVPSAVGGPAWKVSLLCPIKYEFCAEYRYREFPMTMGIKESCYTLQKRRWKIHLVNYSLDVISGVVFRASSKLRLESLSAA